MKRIGSAIALSALLAFGAVQTVACTGTTTASATVSTSARLVYVGPGLWVVEAWPSPVFWYDGYYWMITDGIWYRSLYFDRSFVRVVVTTVPRPVIGIRNPRRYVHYRAPRSARVRPLERAAPRTHRSTTVPRQPAPHRRDRRGR